MVTAPIQYFACKPGAAKYQPALPGFSKARALKIYPNPQQQLPTCLRVQPPQELR